MKNEIFVGIINQIVAQFNQDLDAAIAYLEARQITVKRGGKYDHLAHLSYSQIGDHNDPISNACRGLVLSKNEYGTWSHACVTYDRFFDMAMGCADKLDMATCWAEEKADGSLIQLWWDDESGEGWKTSTTGSLFGHGESQSGKTFNALFWEAIGYNADTLTLDPGLMYAFELCTPSQQIVLYYEKPKVILHSARYWDTLELLPRDQLEVLAESVNCELIKIVPFDWENQDLMRRAESIEGWVLKDAEGRKAKVKTQWYLDRHHALSSGPQADFTVRKLVWAQQMSEVYEIVALKPSLEAIAVDANARYFALFNWLTIATNEIWHKGLYPDHKSKAIAISKLDRPSVFKNLLFMVLNKKAEDTWAALRLYLDYPNTSKSKIEALQECGLFLNGLDEGK